MSLSKNKKILRFMLMLTCMVLVNATAAFATGEIKTAVNTSGVVVFNTIVGIASAAAGAAASVALVQMLVIQNPQKIDRAKTWLVRIVIAFVLINGIGTILRFANGLGGSTLNNNFNSIMIN